MKTIAYRVGLTALGALILFVIDATLETILFDISTIVIHLISIIVAAGLAFLLLLYGAPQVKMLRETRRQPDLSDDSTWIWRRLATERQFT